MAEPRTITPDPVAGLIDIPLPRAVGFWPQTWEARLSSVLLLVAVIAGVWRWAYLRRVNRYRRRALSELSRMKEHAQVDLLADLAILVRRTALTAFPREEVAPLFGPAWLAFLDRSYGGKDFSEGVGRLLANGPYQRVPPTQEEVEALVALVRRWIRGHHA
ncbi:DUF4381 domain-containing protein [Bradyrhizobium sp. DOA1]|uniref:DUF4381 domain-containing protein n=1 Tax=Bradyrhizobium sp. DOA1 TaxID=1126616 RepID=UPI000A6AA6D4|nr:DUF4381 domain-containing protein [Bradyrhizobium sp. DOA1]